MADMRVHLGSDHAGVELRRVLAESIRADHELSSEIGPDRPEDSVDYPDVATLVCERVLADPGSFGVLVCGTGQGMAMTANKIAGIRAAVVLDGYSTRMAREHNDANVLCLGARVVGVDTARDILHAFLDTEFEGGRHVRRVSKIERG
jgi:ribose 5-phosphate isomerase B